MIPHRTPFILPLIYPSLTWRIETNEPEIFLTFDDGPVDGPTSFVIDELQRVNASATFFCIGDNVRKYPDQLSRLMEAGHAIGNHTYNHLNGWKTSNSKYLDNVKLFERELENRQMPSSTLFRPPYGRITFKQVKMLSNFRIVMWDVLTQDYNRSLNGDKCLRGSINAVRPGSIVVFHDSFKAEKNLTFVLPRFLDHFLEKGFRFKSIPR